MWVITLIIMVIFLVGVFLVGLTELSAFQYYKELLVDGYLEESDIKAFNHTDINYNIATILIFAGMIMIGAGRGIGLLFIPLIIASSLYKVVTIPVRKEITLKDVQNFWWNGLVLLILPIVYPFIVFFFFI